MKNLLLYPCAKAPLGNFNSPNRNPKMAQKASFPSIFIKNLSVFLMLILVGAGSSLAQNTATIGTGTTETTSTGNDPIDGYYESFRYQVVYTAAELTAAGMVSGASISELGFSISEDYAGGDLIEYQIKMGETTAINSAAHDAATTTIVKNPFDYNPTVTAEGAFDMITFDAPFIWNGGNILIDICSVGPNAYTSPYGKVRTIAASTANGSRFVRADVVGSQCGVNTSLVNSTKPQISFTWSPGASCTGVLDPGPTTASTTLGCEGAPLTLGVTNPTSGATVSYQWYANGAAIPSATSSSYTTAVGATTSYYCVVSCGSTSTSVTSEAITVVQDTPTNCYCVPTTTYGCEDGDVIARVTLSTLDNNSGTGCPSGTLGYSNYTADPALTATLLPSTSYNCTVYAGQWAEGYAAWIDYNDDGIFDPVTERIGFSNGQVTGSGQVGVLGSSATFPVVLSCNPPAGDHRMRVRAMYNTNGSDVTPCTSNSWGETEDYLITIAPAPVCPSPGSLNAGSPTATSLQLNWILGCSAATNYDIEYGPVGFVQGTGTTVSNVAATVTESSGFYTLNGLAPNTAYDVYYRANCGLGDVSAWSLYARDTTLCIPITSSETITSCDTLYVWNNQTYTQSGVYTFNGQTSSGCDSTVTLTLVVGASVVIATADAAGNITLNQGGASYQWIDCSTNSPIIGAATNNYTPLASGNYACVVGFTNGCSDTSNCVSVALGSLSELNFTMNINPNPSDGIFNVYFSESVEVTIRVTDSFGKLVSESVVKSSDGLIDLSTYENGIYYLIVNTNDASKVFRIIKT